MILRNDIKRIVGELAQKGTIRFNLMDCYNLIDKYCKKNKCNPTENTYEVINRKLLINNEIIGIVEVNTFKEALTDEEWKYLEDEIGYGM